MGEEKGEKDKGEEKEEEEKRKEEMGEEKGKEQDLLEKYGWSLDIMKNYGMFQEGQDRKNGQAVGDDDIHEEAAVANVHVHEKEAVGDDDDVHKKAAAGDMNREENTDVEELVLALSLPRIEVLDVEPLSAQPPEQKKKRGRTPSTMVDRIKKKERKEYKKDPLFHYTSEPGKPIIISAEEYRCKALQAHQKLTTLSKSPFWKIMTKDEKEKITAFYRGANKTAWGFACFPPALVNAGMFEEILFKKFIHSDVQIDENKRDGIERNIRKRCEEELHEKMDHLIFPFNSGEEKNHWVMLILDMQSWDWYFYDSIRPRRKDGKHFCLEHARRLKSVLYKEIHAIAVAKKMHVEGEREVYSIECAQQKSGSNACAIFVTHFMENVVKKLTYGIELDLTDEAVNRRRIELLVQILDDNDELEKSNEMLNA